MTLTVSQLASGKIYTATTSNEYFKVDDTGDLYTYDHTGKKWDICTLSYNEVVNMIFIEFCYISKMENIPVDKVILVKENLADEWKKAHFAKYFNDIVYVWSDGKSSETADSENDVQAYIIVEANYIDGTNGEIVVF